MKKIIGIITLLVMVLVVVPQVMAQTRQEMQDQMRQLTEDFTAGRITHEEYTRRITELTNPTVQRAQQTQQAEQQQEQSRDTFQSGATRGWPSNSIFRQVSLPNLRQPSGTTVSYDFVSESRSLAVYIKNGTQAHLDALSREISGGNEYRGQTQFRITRPMPSGFTGASYYYVDLELQDGGIVLITNGGG